MAKPPLQLVEPAGTYAQPPRQLGEPGLDLWRRVQAEYGISDVGGLELLAQACAALDRAEALAALIAVDGEVIKTRAGPKAHPALRDELAARAFVCRTLERLGITTEPVKAVGRPPGWMRP